MVKEKKSLKKKIAIIGTGIIAFVIIVFVVTKILPFFWGVFIDKKINIKKSEYGTVNVLIMGIGGGTHDGPNLTDTIILASINPDKNTVNFVSIPRDLYVPSIKGKINSAYSNGEDAGGRGIAYAKGVIDSVTGVYPDYAVVLDFSGFVKLVDTVGGVDVNVHDTLDDYAYPVEGKEQDLCGVSPDSLASYSAQIATGSATEFDLFPCRFTHLHVPEGVQHMDGILALEFVRSRHALGPEGSDFARSRRQQLVIDALRNKILSLGTLANPLKVIEIINILKDNIHTDIPSDQYDDFIKLAQKMKHAKISNNVIDQGDASQGRYGLLINPPLADYGGAWVLVPRAGGSNYSEIKKYVGCIFKNDICTVSQNGVIDQNPAELTPSPPLKH